MNIAFIPARSGSKGIPMKNLKTVNGESLLSRTIRAAIQSKKIDHIYVSSDSEEILSHAFNHGAKCIKRSELLSQDQTSSEAVLIDALSEVENNKIDISIIVLLQCTSTFTSPEEIDTVVSELEKNKGIHDSAFAASISHSFLWNYNKEQRKASGINHQFNMKRKRRQELDSTQYLELGSVYAVEKNSLLSTNSRFGNNPLPVALSSLNSFLEIDTFEDLKIANIIASNYSNNE